MAWYHLKPKISNSFKELTHIYNEKYGHFDYSQDSRSIDLDFNDVFLTAVGDISDKKVLVCGSNSGYEIRLLTPLFPNAKFTAVDISTEALDELRKELPNVFAVHESMDKLSFEDKSFDVYVNCRAIHSSDVNIESALNEADRITRGKIIISVSNGYKVDNKIVNGMFDYESEKIDTNKPFVIADKIKEYLTERNYEISDSASKGELFIVANPKIS